MLDSLDFDNNMRKNVRATSARVTEDQRELAKLRKSLNDILAVIGDNTENPFVRLGRIGAHAKFALGKYHE